MSKYHKKDKYDLEDCVNHFLIYYNNRKHSTTGIAPYVIMRNVNDQELIQKIITKTEKTRNKIKRTIDNYEKGQIVGSLVIFNILKTVIISSTNTYRTSERYK